MQLVGEDGRLVRSAMQDQIRLHGHFEGAVDTGKILDLTAPRLRIESLGVPLLGNGNRRIDIDFGEADIPGDLTRLDSAMRAGRRGAVVMAGVIVMLFVAALLEGFARQLVQPDAARFAIAAATAVLWGVYFYAPRRRR